MTVATKPESLGKFASRSGLVGLSEEALRSIQEGRDGYSVERGKQFLAFQERINRELLNHRVIVDNRYTAWFRKGGISEAQLRAFIIQFSVFSNLFLIAQLRKMINADSHEGMRASKEILANEIGVTFHSHSRKKHTSPEEGGEADPHFLGTEGTVQGGTFFFEAGHFEWLLHIAEKLGLTFNDIGKRRHGTKTTLFFCDELSRLYGSDNYAVSQAASYAVENWAAAGFWRELIEGLKLYNRNHGTQVPLGFFAWHDRLEGQHAQHTQEELEEYYFHTRLNEDAFIGDGNKMLDAVAIFWEGLDEQREQITASEGNG